MTTYAWPATSHFIPESQVLQIFTNQEVHVSPESGYTQVQDNPGAKWGWDLGFSVLDPAELAEIEAYHIRLNGMQHVVSLYDFFRSVPRGTINLSGVTTSGITAQFATTCTLANCGANKTLLAGDWFKIGTQLVMAAADATANGSGVMTVEFRHMLRAQVGAGSAVVLDKPTSTFRMADRNLSIGRKAGWGQEGPTVRFIERY